jgi:hypothetical protein
MARSNGQPTKLKARFVAKDFEQQKCITYEETFALVAKWNIIHSMVALVANYDRNIHHMDIKFFFLNKGLKKDMYLIKL